LIKSGFQIKLADFGVSKKLIKEKLTTIAGTLVGTPSYLSPVLWEAF
jgi:NIMA (never in mitosis gene a)-related kinase